MQSDASSQPVPPPSARAHAERPALRARTAWCLLALIVIAGWAARARGLDWQLPQWTHSDGNVLRNQTAHLRREFQGPRAEGAHSDVPASGGYYPLLSAAVMAVVPSREPDVEGLAPLERALELARAPWLHLRRTSAWIALGAVIATYALARRFVGRWSALFAAALVSASLLHVTFSSAQRPHALFASVIAWALFAILWARRRARFAAQLAGALGFAASASTLQSGFAVLPAWGLAWILRRERRARWREALALLAALALVGLALRWAYSDPEFAQGGITGRHVIWWSSTPGLGLWVLARALIFYEPVLLLGVVAALAAALLPALRRRAEWDRERRDDMLTCLGFVLPYGGFFALFGGTFERFALPLLPFAAIAAAWGLGLWGRALLGERRVALACAALALLALPVAACWRLGELRSRPDTLELAARWIERRASDDRRKVLISSLNLELPFFYSPESLARLDGADTADWTRFQRGLLPHEFSSPRFDLTRDRDLLREDGQPLEWEFDFVVLNTAVLRTHGPEFEAELKRWRAGGVEVELFAPSGDESEERQREELRTQARTEQMFGIGEAPALDVLFRLERLGPRLRVLARRRG
ncbi:MAG: hypothetical protein FJ298_00320 [Planctomycetes bacterium]|nr:hypothetical protein [Planctomycetota bacterium]